jgi:hypothetical protein
MARRGDQGHFQRDHVAAIAVGGHAGDLHGRISALHGGEQTVRRDEMPARANELGELGERARYHNSESDRRLPSFRAPFVDLYVAKGKLDRRLTQKCGLLLIRVV